MNYLTITLLESAAGANVVIEALKLGIVELNIAEYSATKSDLLEVATFTIFLCNSSTRYLVGL